MNNSAREAKAPDLHILNCRGKMLDCRLPVPLGAHIMGILNVTPDSFYDGGKYVEEGIALKQVELMIREGASIIDVGGESTRPKGSVYGEGALALDTGEEILRIVPIIEAINSSFPDILISIDTYKSEVARAAMEAGAHMINDVTGLRFDPQLTRVAKEYDAPIVVMHSLGNPGAMPHHHKYDDVVQDVYASLKQSLIAAEEAGVIDLVVDPGFGFGKTPEENFLLINHTDRFLDLGRPVLVGLSRKSAIGHVLKNGDEIPPPAERLFGSLGATAIAVLGGASIIRTHDVRPTFEFLKVMDETRKVSAH